MTPRPSFDDDLALHELKAQPTGVSYPFNHNASDDCPEGHSERMNEFLNRPATPPPFPDDLPTRPARKPVNKWMLVSFALVIALLGSVLPLAVLLGITRSKAHDTPAPLAAQVPNATTVTTLMHHTTTETSLATITSVQTFSFPDISYVTATITLPPQSTGVSTGSGDPFDPVLCNKVQQPLFLARNYCVMVKTCNEAFLDTKENDCKGFCETGGCTIMGSSPQVMGCCEHCKCDGSSKKT